MNVVKPAGMMAETASITPNTLDHFVGAIRWINEAAFKAPQIPKTSATSLAVAKLLQRLTCLVR